MTTVAQIITDAYQTNNLLALTATPTAEEEAKALRATNRVFRSLFGAALGEYLKPINVGDNNIIQDPYTFPVASLVAPYFIPNNARLLLNITSAITVYLPSSPQDGARFALQDKSGNLSTFPITVVANGTTIESATQVAVNTDNANIEWFYRADLGNWQKVSDLALLDDFPLPLEFEDLFISLLALRLDPSEGIALDDQIAYVMKQLTKKMNSKYRQKIEAPSELGLLYLTNRSYDAFTPNGINFTYG